MRAYTVLSPLTHDHRHYPIGSPVDLDDDTAAILLVDNVISAPELAAARLGETLLGSDYLPVLVRISKDLTVKTTEVVERAFLASGLDHAGWNGLADADRELRIVAGLELLRDQSTDRRLDGGDLGNAIAAAEGERVLRDNASDDPERDAQSRLVVQHTATASAGTSDAAIAEGTILDASGNVMTPAAPATAVVIDPVAVTHTKTATAGKARRD